MPTMAVEDYLKAIYLLTTGTDAAVPPGRIASRVGVTSGTVTTMMKRLAERGLVSYEPSRGVRLTDEGRDVALRVLRRHRLVELFLVRILGLDWADVHEEAEALEHAISDRVLERMDELLGRPTVDPHGDPIPAPDGSIDEVDALPLTRVEPGTCVLVRVVDDSREFLGWLSEVGLRPGMAFDLVARSEPANTLTLRLRREGDPVQIGLAAADKLFVRRSGRVAPGRVKSP